jgi:hypothetical protein
MADLEDRLRDTLRRKAVAIPPRREVPPGLLRRALARIARNVSAIIVAVAVVAIGAVTGVHALSGPSQGRVATTPPPVPACLAADLSGSSHLSQPDGESDTREGSLTVSNNGTATCSLRGNPVVRVLTTLTGIAPLDEGDAEPFWRIRGPGKPPDWPVVTLLPGDKARIHVIWSNSCGAGGDPTRWEIELPAHGGKVTFDMDTHQDIPTCLNGGAAATLKVGPFEP